MKRFSAIVGALALMFTLTACDITPGGRCDQLGTQHTNDDGKAYRCIKNVDTGKNFWAPA